MDHEWTFMAVAADGNRYVINVCIACGEARYKLVAAGGGEKDRVDLSGDCPGRPQRPSRYETRGRANSG